jgi:hypothetical protein
MWCSLFSASHDRKSGPVLFTMLIGIIVMSPYEQYSGQNLGDQFGNGAIITKTFVGRARFIQGRPLG